MSSMSISSSSGGMTFSVHKPLVQCDNIPAGRGGSSIVYADGKMVAFGGHFFAGDDKFEYLDETWLFDVEKLEWYRMTCSGQLPGPRYGHSACIFGSRMFIFGGKGPDGIVYKDIFFLDLVEWIWVPVKPVSKSPSPRFFHAAETVGKKIVIHGGWDGTDVLNDLWIFNTDSFAWMQPRTTGFAPTERYGHTLTLTPDGRLLIFGGCTISKETGIPKYNDDVRQLDTNTMVWIRPRIDGPCPTGRYGHSATIMDNGKIVIFGGWGRGGCQSNEEVSDIRAHSFQILDTKSMTWHVPNKIGKKDMKHLYNHGACRSTGTSAILFFGGFDGRQAINDFYVANIDIGINQNCKV